MTVDDILNNYDERVVTLASALRSLVLSQLKNVIEIPDQSANLIGYGYGPGYKDTICTLLLSKKGVKLGFYRGSELPDPAKLLTGTGKVHRFVEIKTGQDLSNSALKKLLKEALSAYKKRVTGNLAGKSGRR